MKFQKHVVFALVMVMGLLWGAAQTNNVAYAGFQVGGTGRWTLTPTKSAQPVLTATPTSSATCASYNQAFETRVLELINQERAKVNLPALKAQSQLATAARAHSADMGCHNYFSHTGLNGSTVATRVGQQGYKWKWIGENIAAGSNTPEGVMQQWMNSAPHKANILSPNYTDVGVGYAYSSTSTYKYYWTLDFGKP